MSDLRKLGFEVGAIFDDELGTLVQPEEHEQLWFAFGGMAMGWSWALFLANEAVVHQAQLGSGLTSERFLRDKRPGPDVRPGPVVGVYVDNINVVGKGNDQVAATMDSIAQRFQALGIPFDITDPAGQAEVESLGFQFSFDPKVTLRNKSSRAWRLDIATKAILKRKRVSGDLLRVWLGHTNFFFQLNRLGLSCLSAVYKFSAMNLGRRASMWPNVRRELRQIMGLIFLVERELTASRSEVVRLGDSSSYGFALMSTTYSSAEIGHEVKFREKWRFIEGRLEN